MKYRERGWYNFMDKTGTTKKKINNRKWFVNPIFNGRRVYDLLGHFMEINFTYMGFNGFLP